MKLIQRKMTTSAIDLFPTPPKFNNAQCQYLAEKNLNRGEFRFPSPELDTPKCLEVFKLLYTLANVVEHFIESCCKPKDTEWIQAAMFLTDASEHVSAMSFHLELCSLLFLAGKELRVRQKLTQAEVDVVFKAESIIVSEKAFQDRDTLKNNVTKFIGKKKNWAWEKTSKAYPLADFLLRRLEGGLGVPAKDSPGSAQASNLYETLSSNLKQLKRKLGSGSFAVVHKAMWLGAEVAMKTFDEVHFQDFEKELTTLAKLSHPNIMSLLCYAKDQEECSIVMELMDKDLLKLIKGRKGTREFPFDVLEAIDIMLQVGGGMHYLHNMSIVHRDLKSANILVRCLKVREADPEIEYAMVKVADFGLSKIKEKSATYSIQTPNIGTTLWMAPEMIKHLNAESEAEKLDGDTMVLKYPFKSDVYSFAMVCYEILSGKLPWNLDEKSLPEVKKKVLRGDRPQLPEHCPLLLKSLIERCWSQDASQRPDFNEICTELRHLKFLLLGPSKLPFVLKLIFFITCCNF
jgi:hypothetical protein